MNDVPTMLSNITLRDYFAGQVLPALITYRYTKFAHHETAAIATAAIKDAYVVADEMVNAAKVAPHE
jgi:hypothetical protein